jgi:hypothetical protein
MPGDNDSIGGYKINFRAEPNDNGECGGGGTNFTGGGVFTSISTQFAIFRMWRKSHSPDIRLKSNR